MSILTEQHGFRRAMLIAGACGVAVAFIGFVPSPVALIDAFATTPVLEVKVPPPFRLQPMTAIESFAAIAERPLFNADRKPDPLPPPPEAAKPLVVLGDLSQYRVLGVTGDSAVQRALVQKTGGQTLTLKPGDMFEGWSVDRIDAAGIAISGGDRKEVLTIPKARNLSQSP